MKFNKKIVLKIVQETELVTELMESVHVDRDILEMLVKINFVD